MTLLQTLRAALRAAADPAKAPGMQAYMKSAMPYHGVNAPALRRVCRQVFTEHRVATKGAWRKDVLELWRGATHREERYGAIELSGDRRARAFQTPATLDLYEEIIVTGAWWDYVDVVAIHRVGPLLLEHAAAMRPRMLAWSHDADLWKRRTSIICQVSFKERTDLDLLYSCIAPSLESREFFLRKAIGWALRQYAWIDKAEILRYVSAHEKDLSPLSRREALINVEGRRRKASGRTARTCA